MQCCFHREKPLELETAIKILENVDDYSSIEDPAIKPHGGEVYLFVPRTTEEQDNWKCDQYRWLNNGPKEIPRRGPLIRKLYFLARTPKGKTFQFQRHAYLLIADQRSPKPVLVHYIGDETCMVDFPHGNSKRSAKPFYPVCPSVRKDIVKKPSPISPDAITPHESETISNEASTSNPVMTPRNKNQIRNLKRRQKLIESEHKLKKSSLENIHEIAIKYPNFVRYFESCPCFICVVGLSEIGAELKALLRLPTIDAVVFSYSEPFKLGKLFISSFVFSHGAFIDRPGFPTHFVIYDKNVADVHRNLIRIITEDVPFLKEYKGAILMSPDSVFSDVFHEMLPNLSHVFDWEHVLLTSRMWLRAHGFSVSNINILCSQIRLLLNSTSKELYVDKLQQVMEHWTMEFIEFFESEIKSAIEERLGRWILQKFNLYSQPLGVASIVNQGSQLVFHHMQEMKDISVDKIVTAVYLLQVFLTNEISKGFCNVGNCKLRPELGFLKRDEDEVYINDKVCRPDAIFESLKNGKLLSNSDKEDGSGSILAQAVHIAAKGDVVHSSHLQGFLVKGINGELHAVMLYPLEKCTCSAKFLCSHLLAVKCTLGMVGASKPKETSTREYVVHAEVVQSPRRPVEQEQEQEALVKYEIQTPTMAEIVVHPVEGNGAAGKSMTKLVTLDSFIEALAVARECVVSSATPTTATPSVNAAINAAMNEV